jgi:hypothetical protein
VSPRTLGPARRQRPAWSRRCGAIGAPWLNVSESVGSSHLADDPNRQHRRVHVTRCATWPERWPKYRSGGVGPSSGSTRSGGSRRLFVHRGVRWLGTKGWVVVASRTRGQRFLPVLPARGGMVRSGRPMGRGGWCCRRGTAGVGATCVSVDGALPPAEGMCEPDGLGLLDLGAGLADPVAVDGAGWVPVTSSGDAAGCSGRCGTARPRLLVRCRSRCVDRPCGESLAGRCGCRLCEDDHRPPARSARMTPLIRGWSGNAATRADGLRRAVHVLVVDAAGGSAGRVG